MPSCINTYLYAFLSGIFIADICPGSNSSRILFFSFVSGNVSLILQGQGLIAPNAILWSSKLGLLIADGGANCVFQLPANVTTSPNIPLEVVAGNGAGGVGTTTGPALQANLDGPVGLMFHPFNSSLLISDASGIRVLTLQGFIPDPPPIPYKIDVVSAVAAAITTSVSLDFCINVDRERILP